MNRVEEQVFFPVFYMFFSIHLPPVEEGEFLLYIMLKMIKRTMYGRCRKQLLEAKLRYVGNSRNG